MGPRAANATGTNMATVAARLFCTVILAQLVGTQNKDFFFSVKSSSEQESPVAHQVRRKFWFGNSDSPLPLNPLYSLKALEKKLKKSLLDNELQQNEEVRSTSRQVHSQIDLSQSFVSQKQGDWKAPFLLQKIISLGESQSVLQDTGQDSDRKVPSYDKLAAGFEKFSSLHDTLASRFLRERTESTQRILKRRRWSDETNSNDPNSSLVAYMNSEVISPNRNLSPQRKKRDLKREFSLRSSITDGTFERLVGETSESLSDSIARVLRQPYYVVPIPIIVPLSHNPRLLSSALNLPYSIYLTEETQRPYGTSTDIKPILRPVETKSTHRISRMEHQVQNPFLFLQGFNGYFIQLQKSAFQTKKTFIYPAFGPYDKVKPNISPSERACVQYQKLYEKYSENDPDHGITERVGKGEQEDIAEFPYMVAIGCAGDSGGIVTWHCAGSLIREDYVLTAAHCVSDAMCNMDIPRDLVVRAGATFVGPSPERASDRRVEQVCLHPEWDRKAVYHDLALLRLQRPLELSAGVRPVCLPRAAADDVPPSAEIPLVSGGWADRESTESLNKSLEVIHVDLLSETNCIAQITNTENLPLGLGESTLCVQGKSESSYFCRGDSGGPLVARAAAAGVDELLGVLAQSDSTCASSSNALFSSTREALPWIEDIVWG